MRAARIYRLAELIGGKINHLQVQACHGPAKGCLLGRGQRRHTLATQPRLGRACGRGDRGELRRSPRICPEQEGRYLGRRPAVNRCWGEEVRTQCARDGVLFRTAGRPELRIPNAAAQTRIVSKARIRLDSRKSVRSFKGIICVDISEFESYMTQPGSRVSVVI